MLRAVRALALTLIAALAVTAACTTAPPAPATAPAPTPAAKAPPAATVAPQPTAAPQIQQSVTMLGNQLNADMDPFLNALNGPGEPIFQKLMKRTPGDPTGVLAASWTSVDPTTWRVTLKDARFSNNDPVRSEDVAFAFELARDAARSAPFMPVLTQGILSATAIDPRTVEFTTRAVDPLFLNRLATVPIFSKAAYERLGREGFNRAPIGSGPFVVRSITPQTVVEFAANENYWGPEKPRLRTLTMKLVAESVTRVTALRTGEADIARQIALDNVDLLRQFARAESGNLPSSANYQFDTNVPPFDKVEVRTAINIAVDRNTITRELMKGVARPTQGQPATANMFGFNPQVPAYPFDSDRARQLLAQGGYPNGFATELVFNTQGFGDDLNAQAIQPYLTRIGINVSLRGIDSATYMAGFRPNRLGPFVTSGFSAVELMDPSNALSRYTCEMATGGGRSCDPVYDRLYLQQVQDLDRNRRRQAIQQMMQILHTQAPGLYLWNTYEVWGVTDRVTGFALEDTGLPGDYSSVARVR